MKSSEFEQYIGIETYFTQHLGIRGKLRENPEDFIVHEIFLYPKEVANGRFLIAEISCKNWETHRLVRELSKRLKISQKRISFAGTKDKRALSIQLMSFYNVSKETLSKVTIKDVTINGLFYSDKSIRIGDLLGNKFEIIIRNINNTANPNHINSIVSIIESYGGFPNFYGYQRFGIIRPVTHIIGKYLINGDFESAVMTYIGNPIKGEDEITYELRKELQETRDFKKALHSYPETLSFEKAILNRLVIDSNDFIGAIQELPKNLLLMFVNAYQSFLFNKIISERLRRNIALNQAITGDIIIPIRKNIFSNEYIFVTKNNIDKVNKQISKNKAVISGLLIGYESVFSQGEMNDIETQIIEQEKIDYRDFIIPEIPYLSSSGSRRPVLAMVDNIEWDFHYDKIKNQNKSMLLRFDLHKGCYATSLLRELMKSDNPRDY
jgi:tRNA pseudouridine13 synthase